MIRSRLVVTKSTPPVTRGLVTAEHPAGAEIGAAILERGGNAVDAAVAVGFALAVTYPRAGNIGGGGFMVIHLAKGNRQIAIDYRETAPGKATRDMYLDSAGNVTQLVRRPFAGLCSRVMAPGSAACRCRVGCCSSACRR